jgi:hypothetical protein
MERVCTHRAAAALIAGHPVAEPVRVQLAVARADVAPARLRHRGDVLTGGRLHIIRHIIMQQLSALSLSRGGGGGQTFRDQQPPCWAPTVQHADGEGDALSAALGLNSLPAGQANLVPGLVMGDTLSHVATCMQQRQQGGLMAAYCPACLNPAVA